MAFDGPLFRIIARLAEGRVEFMVVGGYAGVMLGAPILTFDLDIVHRRTPENVDRLHEWLLAHGAYHRNDLANRRLSPARELLAGGGHLNLATDLGDLDVLCELAPGEGYDELLTDSVLLRAGDAEVRVLGLERLIAVKTRTGRPKDRAVLPVLMATLDERKLRKS
jgi:hypothetical protein